MRRTHLAPPAALASGLLLHRGHCVGCPRRDGPKSLAAGAGLWRGVCVQSSVSDEEDGRARTPRSEGTSTPTGSLRCCGAPSWAPCGRAHPDRQDFWSRRPSAAAAVSNQGLARANAPAVGMRRSAPATRAENLSWAGRPRPERPNGYGRRHRQRNHAAEHCVEPPTIGCGLVDPGRCRWVPMVSTPQ